MLSKSRLARLLTPRFGVAWLFVGMLLFISAAGWWKFHRDLYVEEVEVIRSLKASAGKVTVRRADLADFQSADDEDFDGPVPWNAPLLAPVQRIYVEGEIPNEIRDAVARLPRLETLSIRPDWRIGVRELQPAVGPLDIEAHLGHPLPEPQEATLTAASASSPLPEGKALDAEHAKRVAAKVHASWHGDAQVPARFLVVSRGQSFDAGVGLEMQVHLVEPGRRYHFYERGRSQRVVHVANEVRHDLDRQIGPWRRESRDFEVDVKRDDEVFRRFPDDEFPYLGPDFHGFLTVSRAIDAMPEFKVKRVAAVDDVRYRVDFQAFTAPRDELDSRILVIDPQVIEWSCVVRSDLDWAPEESRIVQMIQQSSWSAPKRYERRISQRFERRGNFVLLTERAVRDGSDPPGTVAGNDFKLRVYAHHIDPAYEQRIFDPQSLDPEPWPDRRELPWLRWYRVTFLLGCAMAVMLIGRRFVPKRTKAEASGVPRETDAEVTTTT